MAARTYDGMIGTFSSAEPGWPPLASDGWNVLNPQTGTNQNCSGGNQVSVVAEHRFQIDIIHNPNQKIKIQDLILPPALYTALYVVWAQLIAPTLLLLFQYLVVGQ